MTVQIIGTSELFTMAATKASMAALGLLDINAITKPETKSTMRVSYRLIIATKVSTTINAPIQIKIPPPRFLFVMLFQQKSSVSC